MFVSLLNKSKNIINMKLGDVIESEEQRGEDHIEPRGAAKAHMLDLSCMEFFPF